MRLSINEIDFFKKFINNLSNEAKIYLFGSRVDDSKRGGDIDLLVVSKYITKQHIRRLKIEFYKLFGEQKLDIILDDGSFKKPFVKYISKDKVAL